MTSYRELSQEQLQAMKADLEMQFEEVKAKGLNLDMSRGKPSKQQLELAMDMYLEELKSTDKLKCEAGIDCRNYGLLDGIPEARRLLGEMTEVPPENIIIFGNSSLNVMFDTISRSMTHGACGSTPWCKLDKVKFLCPIPGYDRHFRITEYFGIEMINVPMTPEGPDMDMVEELVSTDPAIKGIWCVPKYSKSAGIYLFHRHSEAVCKAETGSRRLPYLLDNAYCIHHLYDDKQDFLLELLYECEKAGNPDMVYKFVSTSKVSFPGSGIAAVAASQRNLDDFRKHMSVQTIGHDKINQLRHVRFFGGIVGMHKHMKKHAEILRPKFEIVEHTLEKELQGAEIGTWTAPRGGYFISFESMDGCAKKIIAKAAEAGVKMTDAGATYPYGNDPHDSNIRIARSFPTVKS